MQLGLEPRILRFERQRHRLPALELRVFRAEPVVFRVQLPETLQLAEPVSEVREGPREAGIDRRQGIGERHARAVRQLPVHPAGQHQPDRRRHQERQADLLERLAHRDGKPDHVPFSPSPEPPIGQGTIGQGTRDKRPIGRRAPGPK
jgi:hypothetical protein